MKFLWTNWLLTRGRSEGEPQDLLHQRRNILFSRFALCGFVVVVAHTIQDATQGLVLGATFDGLIGLVIFTAYMLNEKGRHMAGKILLLTFINLSLAIYCSIIPKHNGIFLFYFPLIGLSSVVFNYNFRSWGFFFVCLSASFLFALVMTDFKLLGDIEIPASPEQKSFLINLTSSSLILVVCINFMMKYNDESERRLMRLAEEIRQKNIHLEKTNSELDRFVYSASHDLRAPLLSVQGIINVARYENKNANMGDYLTMINNQVIKLDSFIKDIIHCSHNSRTEVALQPVNINDMLEDVRENLKFMGGTDQIRWEKEIDDHMEWVTDKGRMGIVLNNLISNAIKYHNYSKDDQWIRIVATKNCSNCCITIKDNGMGIPPEHQPRIFDMFYRAHDNSSGSGLGLYIVKEIVCKMNGEIQLQSQPGHGSTFTLKFPVAAA